MYLSLIFEHERFTGEKITKWPPLKALIGIW